jgi:hypothetical protein
LGAGAKFIEFGLHVGDARELDLGVRRQAGAPFLDFAETGFDQGVRARPMRDPGT